MSRLLATELEDLVRRDKRYNAAKRRALSRLRQGLELDWSKPTSRDELHARDRMTNS